jgi:ADP-ribose pyrophosphatase YjhB (NUDIX family)
MYVTDDMIRRMEHEYGTPTRREFVIPSAMEEVARIAASQRDGRNHDVTLYVRKGPQVIVIAKHFYPPGMYRAPSGGLNPGESFENGIAREIAEECGCTIKLDRFLLTTSVLFTASGREHDSDSVRWRSFVFLADYVSGDFQFTDHHEIKEVRLADWAEFETFGRMMRQFGRGGFLYRAALHETVVELAGGWPV